MRKRIILILSLLSIMLFNFAVNSPISYAETTNQDLELEITLGGSHKPEVDQEFILVIEASNTETPMPSTAVDGIYKISILGEGKVPFPDIEYTHVGEYHYYIYQELDPDNEDYSYDDTVFNLVVIVTNNEETSELEVTYNLYVLGEETKIANIIFNNEYVRDILSEVEPKPDPDPEPEQKPGGLPLTGSVDVYYVLGFVSVMFSVLFFTLKQAKEE